MKEVMQPQTKYDSMSVTATELHAEDTDHM